MHGPMDDGSTHNSPPNDAPPIGRESADRPLDAAALLDLVEQYGASDLHLKVGRPPVLRVAGELLAQNGWQPSTPRTAPLCEVSDEPSGPALRPSPNWISPAPSMAGAGCG